ncbi:hypothetical protein T484DRAFT_1789608 [Baffinella frigidus]|nr:hypothetical protein T484DRAFT_1789608 [Cryptophyta sp. CCMP2293]
MPPTMLEMELQLERCNSESSLHLDRRCASESIKEFCFPSERPVIRTPRRSSTLSREASSKSLPSTRPSSSSLGAGRQHEWLGDVPDAWMPEMEDCADWDERVDSPPVERKTKEPPSAAPVATAFLLALYAVCVTLFTAILCRVGLAARVETPPEEDGRQGRRVSDTSGYSSSEEKTPEGQRGAHTRRFNKKAQSAARWAAGSNSPISAAALRSKVNSLVLRYNADVAESDSFARGINPVEVAARLKLSMQAMRHAKSLTA